GFSVHRGRIPGADQKPRDRDQHGRSRTRARQRFHRTPLALAEVRTHLPRRLLQRPRTLAGVGRILPLLQPSAPTPGARLPYTSRSVPMLKQEEKIFVLMGALPPNPRDLAHPRQDFWGLGSSSALLPQNPGTESALESHPCVALSSAQMPNSL